MPAVSGDSSPLTAAIAASSSSSMPSPMVPVAMRSVACAVSAKAWRSGWPAPADHDGFVGELECAGYVAGLLREVRPNECQVPVGIGLGPAVEETFRTSHPGGCD